MERRTTLQGGIIGFGKVGQAMTELIRNKFPFADITAVCNRSRGKLDIARDKYGIARLTHDPVELCSWDLDFVMVLSSNKAHREHVEAAAAGGIPIFCEKPVATNLDDAKAMADLVEQVGVVNSVNYMLRFLPAYTKIRELCRDGAVGRVMSIFIERMRGFGLYDCGARHWAIMDQEESGGWVIHHACHGIDFAYWTCGEFESVYATTNSTCEESPELVWGMGKLVNGATLTLCDSVCSTKRQTVSVIGTKGQLFLNDSGERPDIILQRESTRGWKQPPEMIPTESAPYPAFFEKSLAHFFDCVQHKRPSPCSIRQACYSLAVAEAMRESARTNTVIRLTA